MLNSAPELWRTQPSTEKRFPGASFALARNVPVAEADLFITSPVHSGEGRAALKAFVGMIASSFQYSFPFTAQAAGE